MCRVTPAQGTAQWQTVYSSSYTQKFFKIITMKNDRVNIYCKNTLQFAICTKSMELFERYLKKEINLVLLKFFFC